MFLKERGFKIKKIQEIPSKQTSNSKHGPVISLVGKSAKKYSFLASISHEKEYAVAAVISFKL